MAGSVMYKAAQYGCLAIATVTGAIVTKVSAKIFVDEINKINAEKDKKAAEKAAEKEVKKKKKAQDIGDEEAKPES